MYLSRILINPRRGHAQRYLRDPGVVHAAVLAASPTQPIPSSPEGRVLWRIDRDNPYQPLLYALTPEQFDFSHIAEEAGYPAVERPFESLPYDRLVDRVTAGAEYAFRLTANPTHQGRRAQDQATQRFGHVTAAQQLHWLTTRSTAYGFTIPVNSVGTPDVVLCDRRQVHFRRNGSRPVTLATATYEGRLHVTDTAVFRKALTQGIGHGKAYGCGLLTLATVTADL
jgi:CRISPR system Cascade subunit CasE